MPYQNDIPRPTDQLSQSQQDILGNFATLYTYLNINHANFGSGNDGKHTYVEFVTQGASPPIVFAPANEVALYSFLNPVSGINQLYINNSSAVQIPIDAALLNNPILTTFGYSYLPSGLIVKWGRGTTTLPNPCTIDFNVAANIPVFTACVNVQLSVTNGGSVASDQLYSASIVDFSPTGFRVWSSNRTTGANLSTTFYYVALGY